MNTTIIYFYKKVRIKINLIQNIFKWMFLSYKCYILIESTVHHGIVKKTSASKEFDICHYWFYLNKDFEFQRNVCNRCHDLLNMSMDLSDIATLNIEGSNYCCVISRISKNECHKINAKFQFDRKK